jgi:hypothetical protein
MEIVRISGVVTTTVSTLTRVLRLYIILNKTLATLGLAIIFENRGM